MHKFPLSNSLVNVGEGDESKWIIDDRGLWVVHGNSRAERAGLGVLLSDHHVSKSDFAIKQTVVESREQIGSIG